MLRNAFENLATESTLGDTNEFADTLLQVLMSIRDQMPRLTREGRVNVAATDASMNDINSPYFGIASNWAGEGTTGRTISRINEPMHISHIAASYLYNQISVS